MTGSPVPASCKITPNARTHRVLHETTLGKVGKAKLIDKPVFAGTVAAELDDDVQHDAAQPKKSGLQRSGGLQVVPSGKLRFGTGRVKSRSF